MQYGSQLKRYEKAIQLIPQVILTMMTIFLTVTVLLQASNQIIAILPLILVIVWYWIKKSEEIFNG